MLSMYFNKLKTAKLSSSIKDISIIKDTEVNRYKLVGKEIYHVSLIFWKIREPEIKDEDR